MSHEKGSTETLVELTVQYMALTFHSIATRFPFRLLDVKSISKSMNVVEVSVLV